MSEIKARLDKVHIMTDRDSAQFDSYELETIRHTVFHARNHIANLESTIRNHEEDSAALPEDMSITETIKMKDKYIAVLTLALEMACAFEENYNYKMCLPEKPDYPQHYIQQATAELEKEATDER